MTAFVIVNTCSGYNMYYQGGGNYTSSLLCAVLYDRKVIAELLANDSETVLEVTITVREV